MQCLKRAKQKYTSIDSETRRFRWNWTVLQLMNSLTGLAFFITVSSLYQFVTSSSTPDNEDVQPGLGLSEIWYTSIVSAQSLGELMGAVIMGTLSRWVYTKIITLVSLGICFTGGLLYGVGKAGWMLLVGRFLIGYYQGSQQANWRSYIGETSAKAIKKLPIEKQEKSTIKYTNFFLAFAVGSFFLAFGPVLGAIAAHIPGLDQFRWPGWFLCIHSAVLFLFVSVVFRERWSDLHQGGGGGGGCGFRKIAVPYHTMVILIFSFFVVNLHFSVVDSLENPILSDNFGLDIDTIPLVFIATLIFYTSSNLAIYLFQRCHVDNRLITMIAFILTIIGCLILADWQSIGGDPCNQFTDCNISVCPNQSSQYENVVISEAVVLSDGKCSRVNVTTATPPVVMLLSCDSEDPWISQVYADLYQGSGSSSLLCQLEGTSALSSSTLNCYWEDLGVWLRLDGSLSEEWVQLIGEVWSPSSGSGGHSLVPFSLAECSTNAVVPETGQPIALFLVSMNGDWSELCSLECFSIAPASSCQQLQCTFPDSLTDNCTFNANVNPLCVAESEGVDLLPCTANSSVIESSCVCEQFSSVSDYNCFWNPVSRITGQYCERCREACLSSTHSINFIQLIVGILFFSPGFPMCRITLTSVASDAMGQASQGALMGVMVASGSLAKFSGPLWGNAAYLSVGRRTWLPMLILAFLQLLVTVLFVLVCRSIKPKQVAVRKGDGEDTVELLSFEKAEDAEDDDVKENIVGLDDEKEAQVSEHCEKFGGNESEGMAHVQVPDH